MSRNFVRNKQVFKVKHILVLRYINLCYYVLNKLCCGKRKCVLYNASFRLRGRIILCKEVFMLSYCSKSDSKTKKQKKYLIEIKIVATLFVYVWTRVELKFILEYITNTCND